MCCASLCIAVCVCVCLQTHVCTGMPHVHTALFHFISSPRPHVHGDVCGREAHNDYDPGGYLEGVGGLWACVCMACRLGRREGAGRSGGGEGRVLAARQDRSWSRSLPSFLLQSIFASLPSGAAGGSAEASSALVSWPRLRSGPKGGGGSTRQREIINGQSRRWQRPRACTSTPRRYYQNLCRVPLATSQPSCFPACCCTLRLCRSAFSCCFARAASPFACLLPC